MCVTNFVKRNPKPVSVEVNLAALSKKPSLISQRLHGNSLPLLANLPVAKPATEATVMYSTAYGAAGTAHVYQNHHAGQQYHRRINSQDVCTNNKPKPKRKRKPQKPGLTAKKNERHFVKHDYHDHAFDVEENDFDEDTSNGDPRKSCSAAVTFPMKLHAVLDQIEADGLANIISWQPHGRCFCIHKPKEFTDMVLPTYLRQAKLTSFQRQLNLYGFNRLTRGKDAGAYYHELFLRGKSHLTKRMKRTKVKGTKFKAASSPEQEPDFYTMPPVVYLPHVSDDSSYDSGSHKDGSVDSSTASIKPSTIPSEFYTSASFEPIPLQVPPRQDFRPPAQSYPSFSPTTYNSTMSNGMTTTSSFGFDSSINGGIANGGAMNIDHTFKLNSFCGAPCPGPSYAPAPVADDVLDSAVNTIFGGTDDLPEETVDFDGLFDPSGFDNDEEVGQIETDLQLGNLLESFLAQN